MKVSRAARFQTLTSPSNRLPATSAPYTGVRPRNRRQNSSWGGFETNEGEGGRGKKKGGGGEREEKAGCSARLPRRAATRRATAAQARWPSAPQCQTPSGCA